MGGFARALGLERQEGHLFPWAPVFFGAGVGLYFALRVEPAPVTLAAAGVAAALMLWGGRRRRTWLRAALVAGALVLAGLAGAGLRAHLVAGPVLEFRYYGPVEGRIVGIDRSASDAVRLTLDRVRLEDVPPARTPRRVRVSLHGDQRWIDPRPGMVVILTGHLSAPSGPAEPGGFDFRRHAWFMTLGAVGYTRSPALVLEPDVGGVPVFAARQALAARVRAALPEDVGGVAAAILAGDRSGIGAGTQEALRRSNLAHLLAISGLHMGLLAGVVFSGLRIGLLLLPRRQSLRWPVKKLAACGALVAAAGYLALSGGNVATVRAFIMVAVALCAVLCDRRALTLRSVAIAALLVLILTPEALTGPGFQMSFAATTALVAVFSAMRGTPAAQAVPRWLRPALAVALSSAVAGGATAPVSMAHFNQVAHFGLLANLLAVPLMGSVVMPAGVLALALMPLGLDHLAFTVMGWGLSAILAVAHGVSDLPGAVGQVPQPSGPVLPLLAAGGLVLVLWQGWGRLAGLVPASAALWLWAGVERPVLLVSDTGRLVGAMTSEGRALSRERGEGFVAGIWLENDGDPADQARAAGRWPVAAGGQREIEVAGRRVVHLSGRRAARSFAGCGPDDVVISDGPSDAEWTCEMHDPRSIAETGALAFFRDGAGLSVVSVRDRSGVRLWNGASRREAEVERAGDTGRVAGLR
ncbi:ComEC family competence protein [Roseivivax jejudonensis]|uniref:ComEC family competence protein n=1 Tax=Roseivivax jejudonensis TaxID=1529041 RepID=A0A1X6Z6V3_9RHOB|nr:ComEC/Rec2 family competence protein [Roseivivax jejudonensis]SLN41877.1 ComEC family competence protein [Roseivivax jejudonensis]